LAVYEVNMADQVAASLKAQNHRVSKEMNASADALAKQLREVQASA
jgi:hypothetical protein